MPFAPAQRAQHKIRAAIDGPSGSGKTLTSLLLATVFADGKRFAVIDSERGSASLYQGEVIDDVTIEFDVMELAEYSPSSYIKAMKEAQDAGYPALVIDSITHEWNGRGGILQMVDDEQKRMKSGSSYQAWAVGKKEHQKFIDAMLATNLHLIVTMRSKTEHALVENGRGGKEVKKLGKEPVQSDGMEYEFDIVADMDLEHNLIVSKTRFVGIADTVVHKPGAEFAGKILAWATSGVKLPRRIPQNIQDRWFELQGMAIMRDMKMPSIDPEMSDADLIAAGKDWAARIEQYDAEKKHE
jgi:hypothetical protein